MGLGFLIDMDGVIYRGSQLIDGADRFIATLKKKQIPFLFLTNNSQRTRRDVAAKLFRMGIDVDEDRIFTCAMATARFLAKQKPGGTAFVIGEGGLHNALHRNGYAIVDHAPDYVVVGEARSITLEMLDAAVQMVLDGAQLIATNLDPNCPTKSGTRSGCGATVSFIEKATGKTAFSVGKPSPVMMRSAQWELGVRSWETVMIGDTMETDILGAVQMGYYATLTLSGGSRAEDLPSYAFRPDRVINSVVDLIEDIENDAMLPAWDHGITPHPMEESERSMYAAARGA